MEPARRPHAVLDLPSRVLKARKIDRLLRLSERKRRLKILEIGAGSGGIAHWLASEAGGGHHVEAVDVVDSRQLFDGYRFTLVRDTALPFPDGVFDAVISNHVIEHVGGTEAQRAHLRELRRVLKPDGLGYLAVPNRWQLVEPHYRLLFLSWLPEHLRTPWLRLFGRGERYDCQPLAVAQVQALLAEVGLHGQQLHGSALRATYELERPDAPIYRLLLKHIPDRGWSLFRRAFPTLIYLLQTQSAS